MSHRDSVISDQERHKRITERQRTQKKSLLRRGIQFLLLLLLFCGGIMTLLLCFTTRLDGLKRTLRYSGREPLRLPLSDTGSLEVGAWGLGISDGDELCLYDLHGTPLNTAEASLPTSTLIPRGEQLLFYDKGGSTYGILTGDSTYAASVTGQLYDADCSLKGSTALLYTDATRYSIIDIYQEDGCLRFRLPSGDSYFNTCALSPDGTMAAVTKMGQTDFTFHTELALYSVAENTAPLCCSLGDQLIYDMKFLTEDTLCAIGENRIFLIGSNGVLKEEYKIEDGVLASCCFSENGYAAGIYTLRNGTSRLVTMDGEGTVQTAVVSSEKPLQLRACGRYLSLLDETQVFLYDDTLRLCFLTEHDGWTQVFPWTDGSFFCHADGEVRHIVP